MPRWLNIVLAGCLLGACQNGLPGALRDEGALSLNIELYRDGLGRDRLYDGSARFFALLTCSLDDDLTHQSDGRHKLEGPFKHGRITLHSPACCRRASMFEIDVWPENLDDCFAKHVGPLDMTSPNFQRELQIRMLCDSLAHFGPLEF